MTAFDQFEVIPAIDIQSGRTVQLVGGERGTGDEYGDPLDAARRWIEEGASILHIVDLDGAFEGERQNVGTIDKIILQTDAEIQIGGGIRTEEDALTLLERGVDRVIIGTTAIEKPSIVSTVDASFPGSVMVSLDSKDGEVVTEGWTEKTGFKASELATRFEALGAGSLLFTNVDLEGRLEGIDPTPVENLVNAVDIPVVASGGVTTVSNIRSLISAGASGVVVGTALYEGRFSLSEALAVI